MTHAISMPDVEYAAYLGEVRNMRPKDQRRWKRHSVKIDGNIQTIRVDG